MLVRTMVLRMLVVGLDAGCFGSGAKAQESVELKAKFQPGDMCYIETDSEVIAKSESPMGDFDMTLRKKRGLLGEVAASATGAKLSLTVDRSASSLDSSMGPSFYDSDLPDEEQSEQWEQILAPQTGMPLTLELDADNNIKSATGSEAIAKKIDATAGGNMFWSFEKPKYTNDNLKLRMQNQMLSIFPNRKVSVGETWTSPYVEELAELKDFHFDCVYTLKGIDKKDGRTLAQIAFEGKCADPDRKFEAEGMMPVSDIKLEKAVLSGTATIDVDRGQLIHREDNAEVAYSGAMGPGENAPPFSASREIKRTYKIRSRADRTAEKQNNEQLAAAKKRKAEEAAAARRSRFADAAQVEVPTATRKNPLETSESWPQWGGPTGDFKSESTGLADKWPDDGPKKLWSSELGDGYSGIVHDGERLYTMYRPEDPEKNKTDEIIVALDPATGKTIWEYKYESPYVEGTDTSFGRGPHSTPIIVGDRIFAVGSMVMMHCLDKNTGSVIWKRDLMKDLSASNMMYGYGASPMAHNDLILLPIGGKGQAVVAFNQSDGSIAWQNQDFGPTHASLGVVTTEGTEQLILFSANEVAGLDPKSGDLNWRIEQATEWGANISTPAWGQDGMLFISSAYGMGSRGVKLSTEGGKPTAKEMWHNNKMKIHHGNAVRVGNFVYGASGDFGPVFYAAVDVNTGELAWKNRDIGKATSIYADGKMIILNENGKLFLTKVSPAELKILSEIQLCKDRTWTAPTLVGKTLFVRDRHAIMALDAG